MSGHIIDMVNRIKQNKRGKRKKFQEENWNGVYSPPSEDHYNFPSLPQQQLDRLKAGIRRRAKKESRKEQMLFWTTSFVMVVLTIVLFLRFA